MFGIDIYQLANGKWVIGSTPDTNRFHCRQVQGLMFFRPYYRIREVIA